MAGATKAEFPTWSHTTTRPLDLVYGAGELNIDNSHRVLTAGRRAAELPAGADGNRAGWAFEPAATTTRHFHFEVAPGTEATTLSAVLAWDREFRTGTLDDPTLADFDLALKRLDGGTYSLVDATSVSASRADNVEHLWRDGGLPPLAAGLYEFEVSLFGPQGADFVLAWRVEVVPVPEPMLPLLLAAAGAAVLRFRSRQCSRAARGRGGK
jgi:hypothetical protein